MSCVFSFVVIFDVVKVVLVVLRLPFPCLLTHSPRKIGLVRSLLVPQSSVSRLMYTRDRPSVLSLQASIISGTKVSPLVW